MSDFSKPLLLLIVIAFLCFHSKRNNVFGTNLECDIKTVRDVLFSEIQNFPTLLENKFKKHSKAFDETVGKEMQLSNINFDKPSQNDHEETLSKFVDFLAVHFPFFSTPFLNSSSGLAYLHSWLHLEKKFRHINAFFQESQQNLNEYSRNYLESSMNLSLSFSRNMTKSIENFSSVSEVIKSLNNTIEKLKLKSICGRNATEETTTIEKEEYTMSSTSTWPTADHKTDSPISRMPRDCAESYARGNTESGLTTIRPHWTLQPMEVWCNHSWSGVGWTVVLRRCPQEVQLDFRRPMEEYENGFGNPEEEHWIGLKAMHYLTSRVPNEMVVQMSIPGEEAFAQYKNFRVGVAKKYKLFVSGYKPESTAGNSLWYHNKMLFSTFDQDKDLDPKRSCSVHAGGGGFWFNICYHTNPTGVYPPKALPEYTALDSMLEWRGWKGFHTFLSHFVMMIRPRNQKQPKRKY